MGCLDDDEILDFVAGRLSDERLRRFDQHVKGCADCRGLVGLVARAELGGDTAAEATTASADAPFAPGVYLGRYEIRRLIGAGGMGVVYAAYDSGLHRMVALKVMRADVPQARLLSEARAMARLSHPNVVSIYDVGVFDGRVFMAMEYVDGVTLARWAREQDRAWTETLAVFVAAAHGLAAAHASGVVHGDFKPANVLVGRDGRVRVSDFGLAWWQQTPAPADEHGGADRTTVDAMTGEPSTSWAPTRVRADDPRVGGTVSYLAPEQLRGRPSDRRTDQFAFCVALYECLYDRHPFSAADPAGFAARVCRGELAPPPADSAVPAFLFRVLKRGLRVDPAARYPTMDALIAALRLSEETVVTPGPSRRRWLGTAARALALAAAGFAAGGSAAALRTLWRRAAAPVAAPAEPALAITAPADMGAGSRNQSAAIESKREQPLK